MRQNTRFVIRINANLTRFRELPHRFLRSQNGKIHPINLLLKNPLHSIVSTPDPTFPAHNAATPVPIAAPIATPNASLVTRVGALVDLRTGVLSLLLFLTPLVVYWPTTFHDFGLRDDYSNLREAFQEPGKILKFCASHARPIYGWLLQSTYAQTSFVHDLKWMRLLASLLLGAISMVSFKSLKSLGWSTNASLCFAALVALVPAAQVIASWAVGWPYAAAALIAIGGFFAAENNNVNKTLSPLQCCVALGLCTISALIYQPSTLFYLVPLSASLIVRRERNISQTLRWAGTHISVIGLSLALAYATMSTLYFLGVFVKSGRIAFEQHGFDKIVWFLSQPLPNALNFVVINDDNQRDQALYFGGATLVGFVLIAGAFLEWRRFGPVRGLIWITGLTCLPVIACAVSLIASERYATYRTIFAMTAVLLCFLIASANAITRNFSVNARRIFASIAFVVAVLAAQHHSFDLIAVPQSNEWHLIEKGAKQVRIDHRHPRIFAIASTPADKSTATIYHDEFGSLSSNSEWVPREMFKRAMHDLHPEIRNLDARYDFATGPKLPAGQHFDVVIDMRRLRHFYSEI